jgi:uncharacterized protein (TIGR03083 family)
MDDREFLLAALARDTTAFTDLLRQGDLDASVPACPGWNLADHGDHLGGVHGWAHGIVVTGTPSDPPSAPPRRDELADWYAERAAELVAALATGDPTAQVWTFGPPPRTVAFWVRRQPLETAVHLRDGREAAGQSAPIDPDLAASGVDEVVTTMFPRQVRLERIPPLARGVRLELTDRPGTSYLLAGDGLDPGATYDATLLGTAEQVFLWLWRRLDTAELSVEGDGAAVAAAFATALTP